MIITTLLENNSTRSDLGSEHGLSLFIETNESRILFDTGASPLFARNAGVLGVDLSTVDLAVISHGHYDHGGGIQAFLELNGRAPIYLQESAFGDYFTPKDAGWAYIGIPRDLPLTDRFIRVRGDLAISDCLEILSEVRPYRFNPPDNRVMFKAGAKTSETDKATYQTDDFIHEQNLVLREAGHTVLITGCAHKGIVNIMEYFHQREGAWPDVVIGGFHLINHEWDHNMIRLVDEIGAFLQSTPTRFYTGHCTGDKAWLQLKEKLGDQIELLSTGRVLNLFEQAEPPSEQE